MTKNSTTSVDPVLDKNSLKLLEQSLKNKTTVEVKAGMIDFASKTKPKKKTKENEILLGTGKYTEQTYCPSEKKKTYFKDKTVQFWSRKGKNTFRISGICESCKKKKSLFVPSSAVPNNLKPKK